MNHSHPYRSLGIMALLSFALMYVLMYAMVNTFSNVLPNYNQFYMAGLMASPMILIELWLMRNMYPSRNLNIVIASACVILLIIFWIAVREQKAIDDKEFLRSMIPHHASAILMCNHAKLIDPEIQALCHNIISGQQAEIDFMKSKLDSLH